MLSDLQSKQEGLLDTKSIPEAEIEAIRILRVHEKKQPKRDKGKRGEDSLQRTWLRLETPQANGSQFSCFL
ncbi:hypothetical protein SLA2020_024440 [Shorea laevis]